MREGSSLDTALGSGSGGRHRRGATGERQRPSLLLPAPQVLHPRPTMRSPFLTAVGASIGTFAVLGGATMLVSGATLSVAKAVVRRRKVRWGLRMMQKPCGI